MARTGTVDARECVAAVSASRRSAANGGRIAFNYNLPLGGQTRLLRPNGRAILNYSPIFYGFLKTRDRTRARARDAPRGASPAELEDGLRGDGRAPRPWGNLLSIIIYHWEVKLGSYALTAEQF